MTQRFKWPLVTRVLGLPLFDVSRADLTDINPTVFICKKREPVVVDCEHGQFGLQAATARDRPACLPERADQ